MISTTCFPNKQGKFIKSLSVSYEEVEITVVRGGLKTLRQVKFSHVKSVMSNLVSSATQARGYHVKLFILFSSMTVFTPRLLGLPSHHTAR